MHVSPLISLSDALAAHDVKPETVEKIVAELAAKGGCECPGCALAKLGDEPVPVHVVTAINDRLSKKIEEVRERLDDVESSNTNNMLSILYLSVGGLVLAWTFITFADEITAAQRRLYAAVNAIKG